jgi:hypothetical protein
MFGFVPCVHYCKLEYILEEPVWISSTVLVRSILRLTKAASTDS